MNIQEIKNKLNELNTRKNQKLQNIEQAQKIIDVLNVDIIQISGAVKEFEKLLPEMLFERQTALGLPPEHSYSPENIKTFIFESNAIEDVYDTKSLNESLNAWDYLKTQRVLTLEVLLKTHLLIMKRHKPSLAGKIRKFDVMVAGQDKYPYMAVKKALVRWLALANQVKWPEDIQKNHIFFEIIHPFGDGNGRTGRLIFLWQYCKVNLPMFIIYNKDKQDYYRWFSDREMLNEYACKCYEK